MSMKPRQRQAVLLQLVNAMSEHGSWCGETHVQKAAYFLKELTAIPLELDFILYKHGPFSFDLRDELTAMQADGLLQMRIQQPPYGPSLKPTNNGEELMRRWPVTLKRNHKRIEFVANRLGPLRVTELERLATALYVTKEDPGMDAETRAQRVIALKPHIFVMEARIAIDAIDDMIKECPSTIA